MENRAVSIRRYLYEHQDEEYRAFNCRLIPNIPAERIIGVRVPALRELAAKISGTAEAEKLLCALPHDYHEENILHGILISQMKDYGRTISALDRFLPYVDNWAVCDLIRPKVFKKYLQELREQICIWLASDHTYTVRFGIEMLMTWFLDDEFQPEYLEWASHLRSPEYYINMMTAWYFATALAKQYDAALPYLLERRLDAWTHNRAIQKAVESRRISQEKKTFLRTLKV